MTPKEKAKEFFYKFYELGLDLLTAKECALIAVEEILEIKSVDRDYELSNYWQEVRQEIEAL